MGGEQVASQVFGPVMRRIKILHDDPLGDPSTCFANHSCSLTTASG